MIDTHVNLIVTLGHSTALHQVHIAPLWPSATNSMKEKRGVGMIKSQRVEHGTFTPLLF